MATLGNPSAPSMGRLASLPRETRDQIYSFVFRERYLAAWVEARHAISAPRPDDNTLAVLSASKQLSREASLVMYRNCTFVFRLPNKMHTTPSGTTVSRLHYPVLVNRMRKVRMIITYRPQPLLAYHGPGNMGIEPQFDTPIGLYFSQMGSCQHVRLDLLGVSPSQLIDHSLLETFRSWNLQGQPRRFQTFTIQLVSGSGLEPRAAGYMVWFDDVNAVAATLRDLELHTRMYGEAFGQAAMGSRDVIGPFVLVGQEHRPDNCACGGLETRYCKTIVFHPADFNGFAQG